MILSYSRWKTLFEQIAATQKEVGAEPLDFVIMAGASSKPMGDAALHNNQQYPVPTDSATGNHLYEISLSDAFAGKFSTAKVIGPVKSGEEDQIIFGNTSIKKEGKITIEWKPDNYAKTLQVSGNGALALARAVDAAVGLNLATSKGVIVLELSAASLYSKLWSITDSGLSTDRLRAAINGKISQVVVQTSTSESKQKLIEKGYRDYLAFIETEYSPSIAEKTAGATKQNYPPLSKNTALAPYYGKYELNDFIRGRDTGPGQAAKTLAPIVKASMVDTGIAALSTYVDSYFTEKLVGLDKSYIDRMIAKAKANIDAIKSEYTAQSIANSLKFYAEATPGRSLPIPTSKTSIKSSSYGEGQSKQ